MPNGKRKSMTIEVAKINRGKSLFYFVLGLLLLFQINLQQAVGVFQYLDEGVAVLCLFLLLGQLLVRRQTDQAELICLTCMVLAVAEGLVCTRVAGVQTNWKPVLMDIGNTFKSFLVLLGMLHCGLSEKELEKIFANLALVVRALVYVGCVCAVVSQFVNIGMRYDVRHGLHSFQFIYTHAALLNIMCYSFVVIQTVDLKVHRQNRFSLLCTMFLWASTLRVRAFFYVVVYVLLAWLILRRKGKRLPMPAKLGVGAVLAAAAAVIARDQFQYYFGAGSRTPRYALVRGGIRTFLHYFPLGSGFGTYGSYAARKYYSPLYYQYGFTHVWGLSPRYNSLLTDNYWPSVMAQLGLIGLVLMVLLLAAIVRFALRVTQDQPYERLAALTGLICVYVASVATDSFSHYTTVAVFFFAALAMQKACAANRAESNDTLQRGK